MARTRLLGWETGYAGETSSSTLATPGSGATASAIAARTGAFGLRLVSGGAGANTRVSAAFSGVATAYWRVYVRIVSSTTSVVEFIIGDTAAGTANVAVGATGSQREFWFGLGTTAGLAKVPFNLNQWYRIEGHGGDAIRLDGVPVLTGANAGTLPITFGTGSSSSAFEFHVDDAVQDDADWPDEGGLVMLLPVADNGAAAASWTKPGGSTTNRYTSVDNAPPIGVADSTSAAQAENQIRNASALAAYVATMQSYDTAGVPSDATIVAVQSHAMVAAPVSTGAKTGSQQITSNPAAPSATAFVGNSGQFWSGAAAGTFPTGWKRELGAIVTDPTVARSSGPVLSLNITGGTASRIAMCSQLGVYADYKSAIPAVPPHYRNHSRAALNRAANW